MPVTIMNKRPTILGLCTGTKLMPGAEKGTEISEAEYAIVREDPTFRSWCKLNWIGVRTQAQAQPSPEASSDTSPEPPPVPESEELSTAGMSVGEAKLVIAACGSVHLLERWHEEDGRKGVKKAIEARLADLEDRGEAG